MGMAQGYGLRPIKKALALVYDIHSRVTAFSV